MNLLNHTLVFLWAIRDRPIEQESGMGIELLDFTADGALQFKQLPFNHCDPFGRMLLVQSLRRKFNLVAENLKFENFECNL